MLAQFPRRDEEGPVRVDLPRAEIVELRSEIQQQFHAAGNRVIGWMIIVFAIIVITWAAMLAVAVAILR